MSSSEDVKTLFRRFGGEAETYQEVVREDMSVKALGKWAMLGQVDISHPQQVPGVRRAVKTGDTRPLTEGLYPEPASAPRLPALRAAVVAPTATPVAEAAMPASAPLVSTTLEVTTAANAAAAVAASDPPPVPRRPPAAVPAQAFTAAPTATALAEAAPFRSASIPEAAVTSISARRINPSANSQGNLSPLAAKLRAQVVSPAEDPPALEAPSNHSLSGLFGRLSKPFSPGFKPGVLRRKFTK